MLTLAVVAVRGERPLLTGLRSRPALLLLAPVPACLAIVADGGADSAFAIVAFAAVGLPATLGWPLLSVACAGSVSAVLVAGAVGDDRAVASAVSSSAAAVAGALAVSLSLYVFARFVANVPSLLVEMRHSPQHLGPGQVAALGSAPRRTAQLTAAERRAVAALARLGAPKVVALDLGIGLATVRSHLKAAKRKTGARTLDELVGIATEELAE